MPRNDVHVEFLYLDLDTCTRCQDTSRALEEALRAVRPALAATGRQVTLTRTHVDSAQRAVEVGLEVSPTVRVDGADMADPELRSDCRECGELCGCPGDVSCRLWAYGDEEHTAAPVGLLVEAILGAAGATRPEPLAVGAGADCGCGPDCC